MENITKNFNRREFQCRCGCGFDAVDYVLVTVLQSLRDDMKASVWISSGCRCQAHNVKVGGSKNSMHTKAKAADIVVAGKSSEEIYKYLDAKFPDKYGLGMYPNFTHIDVRPIKARWGIV